MLYNHLYTPAFQNYGDESNSYNLLYPSIYANHGVFEADFFEPRTKEQLYAIFEGMDIKIPEDVFEELWEEAVRMDNKGEVRIKKKLFIDVGNSYVPLCHGDSNNAVTNRAF